MRGLRHPLHLSERRTGLKQSRAVAPPEPFREEVFRCRRAQIAIWSQLPCINDTEFVDVTFLKCQRKAALICDDWSTQLKPISPPPGRRRGDGKGIGGVEAAIAVRQEESAVKRRCTWLRGDLDSSSFGVRTFILGRDRIGVDADRCDGALWR